MRNVIWQLGHWQAALTVMVNGPAASENIIWDQVIFSVVNRGLCYADRLISNSPTVGLESIPVWERYSKPALIRVGLSQMTGLSKPMLLRSINSKLHIVPLKIMMSPGAMMEHCKKSRWVIMLHWKDFPLATGESMGCSVCCSQT